MRYARAGESGRGFAIVADEVRKLAEQSSDSAKQIENLITQVMGTTNHTVHMMGKVDNEVQAGTQVVMHTEKVFGTITEKVQQVSEQIQTVSMSTDEIARVVRNLGFCRRHGSNFPKDHLTELIG